LFTGRIYHWKKGVFNFGCIQKGKGYYGETLKDVEEYVKLNPKAQGAFVSSLKRRIYNILRVAEGNKFKLSDNVGAMWKNVWRAASHPKTEKRLKN
jgi:hypothetical protein